MQSMHSNPVLIASCKAFAKDHFTHFGALPVEFEFEENLLSFDQYMGMLSEADIEEITGQCGQHGLYPVPERGNALGESFRQWRLGDFVPTYHQARLYQAVYDAVVTNELFYNSDIYEFVINAMSDLLTPELLARNSVTMPTERGFFGMDIYYMTDVVKSHISDTANREQLRELKQKGLKVGSVVSGPYSYGSNTFSSLEITGIHEQHGLLMITAKKRGSSNRWQFSIGASCKRFTAAFHQ